jgi:hypothetical protein
MEKMAPRAAQLAKANDQPVVVVVSHLNGARPKLRIFASVRRTKAATSGSHFAMKDSSWLPPSASESSGESLAEACLILWWSDFALRVEVLRDYSAGILIPYYIRTGSGLLRHPHYGALLHEGQVFLRKRAQTPARFCCHSTTLRLS